MAITQPRVRDVWSCLSVDHDAAQIESRLAARAITDWVREGKDAFRNQAVDAMVRLHAAAGRIVPNTIYPQRGELARNLDLLIGNNETQWALLLHAMSLNHDLRHWLDSIQDKSPFAGEGRARYTIQARKLKS